MDHCSLDAPILLHDCLPSPCLEHQNSGATTATTDSFTIAEPSDQPSGVGMLERWSFPAWGMLARRYWITSCRNSLGNTSPEQGMVPIASESRPRWLPTEWG